MPQPNSIASINRKPTWRISTSYRWFALPPEIVLAAFFLWPIVLVIFRSFTDPEFGVQNYVHVLTAGPYLEVLWLTIKTATVVAVLCLILAYPVAYVMSKAQGGLLNFLAALVIIPLWTSVVIRSYAWMVVFQRRGILNQLLVSANFTDGPLNFIPGTLAVHVGMVHIMLPFMILPLLSNMRAIDRSLLLAANVLGASPFQGFMKVFLPLSMPGVTAGFVLVFMMSLGFFVTPALLGGPSQMMAAVLIEQQANAQLNWGLASALSTVLLLITIAVYTVHVRLSNRVEGGSTHANSK